MYGSVRSQLLQVSVQKSTRTTWPRRARACAQANTVHLAKRPERRANLFGEELRLLPGGEVAAPVGLVEVGEAGVGLLDPAAWGSPDLAGERREADRNRDLRRSLPGRLGCRQGSSVLPVRPGRRRPGARQPVQRDVVEDVLPGEIARGLAFDEGARDLVVAVRVVVEQPGGQGGG